MSRQFDTSGGADYITFNVGNAPSDQGPITIGVLAKASTVAGFTMWMTRGSKAGTPVYGFLTANNSGPKLFAENDVGNGVAGLSTSWRWYVMTKASGNVPPRIHVWDLSGAWTHTDNSANVADGTGPIDALYVGGNGSGSNGWRGSIAVDAAFATQMADLTVEATFTLSAAALLAASPNYMHRFNQASTATPVPDDTGGGATQSAITGTSVDADDPPGFSYALGQTIAPSGLAVPISFGTPTLANAMDAISPTGKAVPIGFGTPTLAWSATIAPSGLAVPIGFGTPSVSMSVAPNGLAVPIGFGTPTLVSDAPPPPPAHATGSWFGLMAVLDAARTDALDLARRPPVACPNDGEPLRTNVDGVIYCPYDGWQPNP